MTTISDAFFNSQWKPEEISTNKKVVLVKADGKIDVVDRAIDKAIANSPSVKTALVDVAKNLQEAVKKGDFSAKTRVQIQNFHANLNVVNKKILSGIKVTGMFTLIQ